MLGASVAAGTVVAAGVAAVVAAVVAAAVTSGFMPVVAEVVAAGFSALMGSAGAGVSAGSPVVVAEVSGTYGSEVTPPTAAVVPAGAATEGLLSATEESGSDGAVGSEPLPPSDAAGTLLTVFIPPDAQPESRTIADNIAINDVLFIQDTPFVFGIL